MEPKLQKTSSLEILCEQHQAQAVFFSNQQQKYKCFKCLLQEQDLIYIDKRFKQEMTEYERIKSLAAEVIQENSGRMNGMRQWKNEIRRTLMTVRAQFQKWVDHFTNQFINSLRDIENSRDLKEFIGEDKRLSMELEGLRDKYMQIMKIFSIISNAPADQKVTVIEQNRPNINQIERQIKAQDEHINRQAQKMKQAQNKTVALDGLSHKIEVKYLKYFEKKINQRSQDVNVNESQFSIDKSLLAPVMSSARSSNQAPLQTQKTQSSSLPQQQQSTLNSQRSQQTPPQKQLTGNSPNTQKPMGNMPKIEQSRQQVQNIPQQSSQQPQRMQTQVQPSNLALTQQQMMRRRSEKNDTMEFDLSEIRQPSIYVAPDYMDNSLSFIPEIIEYSSNTHAQTQQKLTKAALTKLDQAQEEEKKTYDRRDDLARESVISSTKQHPQFDQSSISYRYRHKNQNSIYYLKPRSNDIYLLDFKLQGFVKEKVNSLTLLPTGFSSIQVQMGNIYLVGGMSQDGQISKSCWELDPNMNMSEKAPMKLSRFSVALALLFDKFIFAIGGNTAKSAKNTATDVVEVFDSSINVWYPVASLNRARSCTTACVQSHRYIYVFPGMQSNTWSTIEFMDIGTSIDPKDLKKGKWNLVQLSNPEFNCTHSYGSSQIGQRDILLFGGSKTQTFLLDTQALHRFAETKKDPKKPPQDAGILTLLKNSELCMDAWFGHDSDYISRIYGNYLYALDNHTGNLHVYSMEKKQWNFSTLRELGVE